MRRLLPKRKKIHRLFTEYERKHAVIYGPRKGEESAFLLHFTIYKELCVRRQDAALAHQSLAFAIRHAEIYPKPPNFNTFYWPYAGEVRPWLFVTDKVEPKWDAKGWKATWYDCEAPMCLIFIKNCCCERGGACGDPLEDWTRIPPAHLAFVDLSKGHSYWKHISKREDGFYEFSFSSLRQ